MVHPNNTYTKRRSHKRISGIPTLLQQVDADVGAYTAFAGYGAVVAGWQGEFIAITANVGDGVGGDLVDEW